MATEGADRAVPAPSDAGTVEYFEHHVHEYSARRLRPAVAFINQHKPADAALIDIGCGAGNVLAHLAESTGIATLAGLDVSERCVVLTRERVPAAGVHQASVLDPATVDRFRDTFDFAVLAAVVHHLVGPTRRQSRQLARDAVANALQLVKPGGYLIVMEPTFVPAPSVFVLFWLKTVLSRIFHRRLPVGGYWNNVGAPVVSYYSSGQLRAMLHDRPDTEIVLVDEQPQRLGKLAGLVVSKSNTTVVAARTA